MKRIILFLLLAFPILSYAQQRQENIDDKIYDVVEQPPTYPGGMAALMQYLSAHIKYPEQAVKEGLQGKVTVSFVVESDGAISNVSILRGADPLLDKEAIRVVASMPKWIPGKQNGKYVSVKYFVPVVFRLPTPPASQNFSPSYY